ncbi:MAG: hypothetical protein EBZ48_15725 [Proteobacteria bacterium]|nr:hypothetical protein [Pseudomonadota bacterium]
MSGNTTGHSAAWIVARGADAPDLCALVESRVSARIQAGDFLPDTVQYCNEVSFHPVSGDLTVSDKRLEQLQKLCQLWDVQLRPKEVTSHRKIIGPLIVAAKRLAYPVLGAFLKDSFHQQRSFNAAAIALLAELSEEVERLKARNS